MTLGVYYRLKIDEMRRRADAAPHPKTQRRLRELAAEYEKLISPTLLKP